MCVVVAEKSWKILQSKLERWFLDSCKIYNIFAILFVC